MSMHFTTDQQDATTIFRLKEERLDSRTAGQLKAEFLILAQPDVETLIVDLTDVRYVDSAGLSALLLAQRQMRIHGGEVRLVGLQGDVRALLTVTQLDRIFPIFGTVNDALDAEPSFGDDDDDEVVSNDGAAIDPRLTAPLAPGAPTAKDIRAGAIAAGGSLGAAALAEIMMTPYEEDLENLDLAALGEDEDLEDDDDLDEFDDDDDDDFADDLDEEDDAEEEDAEDVEEDEDLVEDDDFEDDDWDDEELEEDEEEDY